MSLDVSPNGQTIVFDLLGDLYILPIIGGRARPLTSGRAWDAQPRFSPDGHSVAYISDESGADNLWVVDLDGARRRRLSHVTRNLVQSPISSPAWAPDGRSIIVSQRRGSIQPMTIFSAIGEHPWRWLLAAYDIATGEMRWVTDTAVSTARSAVGPVVAPDGLTIYAAAEPSGWSGQDRGWRIERFNLADGTGMPELPPWQGRLGMRPALSLDGRLLAYVTSNGASLGLRLRDLRDFRERWLVSEGLDWGQWANRGSGGGTRDLAPGYAFTPDARAVIIAYGGRIRRVSVASGTEVDVPFTVDVERELAPMALHQFTIPDTGVRTRAVEQPALSPDGSRLAFSALGRLWIMDLAAGGVAAGSPQRLTNDSVGEFFPSWSPDGQWIAYSAWRDGQGGTLRRAWVSDRLRPSETLTRDTALYFNTVVTGDGQRVLAARAELTPQRLIVHWATDQPTVTLVSVPITARAADATHTLVEISNSRARLSAGIEVHQSGMSRWPIEQLYVTADTTRVHVGLSVRSSVDNGWEDLLVLADSFGGSHSFSDISGVVSPDGRRALVTHYSALSEVLLPSPSTGLRDTFNLEEAQHRPFGSPAGAARRWGRALSPWISWSANGRRVLFVQGGSLFVGDVPDSGWTSFSRVDVPLMVPTDVPRGALVLRRARLITMAGESERHARAPQVLDRADVVIRANRIAAIGPSGTVSVPDDAFVLDMVGKTILPGYVDIHDHAESPPGTHPQQWWGWLVRLAHGVTALRDPFELSESHNATFAYQEEERTGRLLAPRIFSTGVAHLRNDRPVQTPNDARAIVTPLADYFGAETFKEYSLVPREGRRWIAAATATAGLNATIDGPQLLAIVDGLTGVEHNLQYGLYDDVLTFIAESGVTLTNTFGTTATADGLVLTTGSEPWACPLMHRFVPPATRVRRASDVWRSGIAMGFGHPEPEYLLPLLRSAAGVVSRGGRVGIGSHGNIPGMGVHYEMRYHALGGMPPHQVLRAATIDGARAIGHAKDLGSLEVGKLADLQILDRNPLKDIHNTTSIRYVMKNGRLYRAADLAEVWPRRRPLDPIYLFTESGATPAAGR